MKKILSLLFFVVSFAGHTYAEDITVSFDFTDSPMITKKLPPIHEYGPPTPESLTCGFIMGLNSPLQSQEGNISKK